MSTDIIKKNLVDILMNRYTYCNNTRGSEYEIYNDFEERFIKKYSEGDILSAFFDTILSISNEKISGLLWLASAYNIKIHKIIPKILESTSSQEKKIKLLEFLIKRMELWPESEFSSYSEQEKKIILKELKGNNFNLNKKTLKILNSNI